MRIISGSHKSKRITAPKNLPVRPTTDMAKEGLFNILNNRYYFDEIRVLDLFSGTGNIAYEFASRGSEEIFCVDKNQNCISFIQQTAQELNFDTISTIQADVFEFLALHNKEHDIIFADPPYELNNLNKVIASIFDKKLLSKEGVLILEHSKMKDFSEHSFFKNTRRYGNVNFSFFEWMNYEE
tara:strand:- start:549 stop:1097 length:549 start_codon:yes stop_codon:yes gene_type:complete